MAKLTRRSSHEQGLHTEQLTGRTQQRFFKPDGKVEHTCGSGPCGKQ